jgi:hypothetical protein
LCRDVGTQTKNQWWEIQANLAIGGFLLPKPLVRNAIDRFLEKAGVFGSEYLQPGAREAAVTATSEVFNVNPVVARIRLDLLYPGGESDQQSL